MWRGCASFLGAGCLGASLLLMPLGVTTVRAHDEIEPSAAPPRAEAPGPSVETAPSRTMPPAAVPSGQDDEVGEGPDSVPPAADAATDVAPDFIPLNTSGYNYRPDGGEHGAR